MKYLTKRQIIKLHSALIETSGGTEGMRDESMLDSALNAPFQTFDGKDLYPSIAEKGVRLGYGLIHNHPFVDGNKRIGTHAMLIFLDINHIELEYSDDELTSIILRVAAAEIGPEELLTWVQHHIL
jgi:death-on-curing protein